MEKHERHCFKNQQRTPRAGELSELRDTGRYEHHPEADLEISEVATAPWIEWVPEDPPPWWPGKGKIWDGQQWVDVPHFETRPPLPGHGCPGGACDREMWPLVDGKPLNQSPRAYRLDDLAHCEPAPPDPPRKGREAAGDDDIPF
jgi:hypothetical protein